MSINQDKFPEAVETFSWSSENSVPTKQQIFFFLFREDLTAYELHRNEWKTIYILYQLRSIFKILCSAKIKLLIALF